MLYGPPFNAFVAKFPLSRGSLIHILSFSKHSFVITCTKVVNYLCVHFVKSFFGLFLEQKISSSVFDVN